MTNIIQKVKNKIIYYYNELNKILDEYYNQYEDDAFLYLFIYDIDDPFNSMLNPLLIKIKNDISNHIEKNNSNSFKSSKSHFNKSNKFIK